jgi:hypothetical protein
MFPPEEPPLEPLLDPAVLVPLVELAPPVLEPEPLVEPALLETVPVVPEVPTSGVAGVLHAAPEIAVSSAATWRWNRSFILLDDLAASAATRARASRGEPSAST